MSDSVTLDDLVKALREESEAQVRLVDLATRHAEQLCPLEPGMVVACANVTHRGKPMVVKAVVPPLESFRRRYQTVQHTEDTGTEAKAHIGRASQWHVYGVLCRKDGSESVREAMFTQAQYEAYNNPENRHEP